MVAFLFSPRIKSTEYKENSFYAYQTNQAIRTEIMVQIVPFRSPANFIKKNLLHALLYRP